MEGWAAQFGALAAVSNQRRCGVWDDTLMKHDDVNMNEAPASLDRAPLSRQALFRQLRCLLRWHEAMTQERGNGC
jgi:hypothetical protein